ncbi:MAG: diguanylate cyclase [Deltaproteobacteria bacterium]|jgi:diguanylate cyclase (GGDEF)-like protein/PAS domain S-box-containing protein|nr:diguanylate cyclase [Deltaproteobacteria bacterium]
MSSPQLFPFPSPGRTKPEDAHAWLQQFIDACMSGILILDEAGHIRLANAVAYAVLDIPPASPPGDAAGLFAPEDAARFNMHCARALRGECSHECCEETFLLESGARCWISCAFTLLSGQAGGQKLVFVTLTDVSAEKAAREQHELSAQRYRDIFDAAADAVIVISPQGTLLDLNKMACEHVNMAREDLVGQHLRTIFTSAREQFVIANLEEILKTGEQRTFEALLTSPDSPIPVEINARLIEFQGQAAVLGIARDITERKILQARLEYQASTDPLTALNNRRHFLLKADQEFLRFKRYGNAFAMLMLDLDLFKNVNDTYGHQTGDALLREFSRQMRVAFRHSDILGRIGGEEFSVLLLESSLHRAIEVAERLRQQVEKSPLQLNDTTVPYTVSIGVTTAGAADASLDGIMRRADAALYQAKRKGRNQVEFANAPAGQEHADAEPANRDEA